MLTWNAGGEERKEAWKKDIKLNLKRMIKAIPDDEVVLSIQTMIQLPEWTQATENPQITSTPTSHSDTSDEDLQNGIRYVYNRFVLRFFKIENKNRYAWRIFHLIIYKNNGFQKKLVKQNTNIWTYTPPPPPTKALVTTSINFFTLIAAQNLMRNANLNEIDGSFNSLLYFWRVFTST